MTAATSVVWSAEFTAFWTMFLFANIGAPPTIGLAARLGPGDTDEKGGDGGSPDEVVHDLYAPVSAAAHPVRLEGYGGVERRVSGRRRNSLPACREVPAYEGRRAEVGRLDEGEIERLLGRCALGDRAAFRSLYDLAAPKLFGVALRILANRGDAEEATQEAFVRIWQRAGQFRSGRGSGQAGS